MQCNKGFRHDEPVVGTRPSFTEPERSSNWRGKLAVCVFFVLAIQFAIFIGHLIWLAEVKVSLLLCCRMP